MKWADFLDSVDPLDSYGFQVRPCQYWRGESPQDRRERLEFNQAIYREFMANGSTFPREIHKERQAEFLELRAAA